MVGAFSSGVIAPIDCEGGCKICATECTKLGSAAQCYDCCVETDCNPTPSWAICYHGEECIEGG